MAADVKEMSDDEIRDRITKLGFGGDSALFNRFCDRLREGLPVGTGVALRGSVVTNERWSNGQPFDGNGEGTSDLDVTLIGRRVMEYWDSEEFYIPGLHTKPLGDQHSDIAPGMEPLRRSLQEMVGRPVNFQATSNLVLFVRDILFDQPYFMLFEPDENV